MRPCSLPSLPALATLLVLLGSRLVLADVKPYISTAAEFNTECKTCPHSLCPNKAALGTDDPLNVTCWTRGTKIMGDNLWLKSDTGCYVTQYDFLEYPGDYKEDLAYCGRASEEEHITTEDNTLRYKSECMSCPDMTSCDWAAYLIEETDLTLTCWHQNWNEELWYKTTNNCYVNGNTLWDTPDRTYLDDCGPVPLIELEKHWNENGTSEIDKREANPEPAPAPLPETSGVKYLINVTIGEEYAYCHSCAKETCAIEKVYEFNQEIWLQCVDATQNGTWWSQTTDFCYVKNEDLWQDPGGDYYRFPECYRFGDPPEDDDKP